MNPFRLTAWMLLAAPMVMAQGIVCIRNASDQAWHLVPRAGSGHIIWCVGPDREHPGPKFTFPLRQGMPVLTVPAHQTLLLEPGQAEPLTATFGVLDHVLENPDEVQLSWDSGGGGRPGPILALACRAPRQGQPEPPDRRLPGACQEGAQVLLTWPAYPQPVRPDGASAAAAAPSAAAAAAPLAAAAAGAGLRYPGDGAYASGPPLQAQTLSPMTGGHGPGSPVLAGQGRDSDPQPPSLPGFASGSPSPGSGARIAGAGLISPIGFLGPGSGGASLGRTPGSAQAPFATGLSPADPSFSADLGPAFAAAAGAGHRRLDSLAAPAGSDWTSPAVGSLSPDPRLPSGSGFSSGRPSQGHGAPPAAADPGSPMGFLAPGSGQGPFPTGLSPAVGGLDADLGPHFEAAAEGGATPEAKRPRLAPPAAAAPGGLQEQAEGIRLGLAPGLLVSNRTPIVQFLRLAATHPDLTGRSLSADGREGPSWGFPAGQACTLPIEAGDRMILVPGGEQAAFELAFDWAPPEAPGRSGHYRWRRLAEQSCSLQVERPAPAPGPPGPELVWDGRCGLELR